MKIPFFHVPGVNRLFVDYIENFDRVAAFFAVDYRSRAALLAQAERAGQRNCPRRELAQILRQQNRRWGAGQAVEHYLDVLANPNSVAVVAGQQVGILGGPLFTLYKALTCLKLAQSLSAGLGTEVVPIFWLATDDDDLAEVSHLTIMNHDNELLPLPHALDINERMPAAQVYLNDGIENCHRVLDEAIVDTEFKDDILSSLRQAYFAGASLPDAFARWLLHLLGDLGLVVMNPADAEVKRLTAPLFAREIDSGSPSTAAVLRATEQLTAADYTPQVSLRPDRLNIFYVQTHRHTLEKRGEGFASTDGKLQFSRTELLQELQTHPERFAPNVLFRPVMQDFLLPTVAYISGPAETAYLAQLRGVYDAFNLPMPAIFPRQSLTLLEKKIDRVLQKYGLAIADFWSAKSNAAEEVISRVVKREAADEIFMPVATAREALGRRLDELKTRATEIDATLGGFIEKEQGKIFHQLEVIEKKLLQAMKRQHETLAQQIAKAAHALYPHQHLQERELSSVPFLCKYGRSLVQNLYEQIDLGNFQHRVVEL